MDAGLVAAIAAVLALPIYLSQWLTGRAATRNAEVELLREMRRDWLALQPQWHKAILTAIGPDDYYSPASMEIRNEFRHLVKRMAESPEDEEEWNKWHQETRDRSHEYQQAERDVLFFLATLASAVFSGQLTPDMAYRVLGPDIVRRSRQIRTLLGVADANWTLELQDESGTREGTDEMVSAEAEATIEEEEDVECPWVYWVDSLPGLTDRILGLLDVLWAEGARRYDLETHDLVNAALLKQQTGSGVRNRLRARRLTREHGARLIGWRLERCLLASEFLNIGPPRRVQFLELELVPPPVQGWGLRGWGRRQRAFWLGRLRRPNARVNFALPTAAGQKRPR